MLVDLVRNTAEETYPKKPVATDEYKQLATRRQQLLRERARLRQELRGADEDKAAGVTLELALTTRIARKMRQETAQQKKGETD